MAINQDEEIQDEEAQTNYEQEVPLLSILSTRKFLTIYFMAVCHLFFGYYYSNVYKTYGNKYINDDQFLTTVGATAGLLNGCFKLVWASALDFFPFRRIYGGLIVLEISLIFLVQIAVYSRAAFFISTCLIFMCDGSLTSMLPALTVSQFGIERGPQVYGYMFSVFGVAALSSTLLFSFSMEYFGYRGMFIVSSVFSITAATLAFLLDEHNKFDYEAAYHHLKLKEEEKQGAYAHLASS